MFQDIGRRVEEVQRAVQSVRVPVSDPGGLVRLTAGPGGSVEELAIADQAYRLSAEELAELITDTMKDGAAKADAEVRRIAVDTMREGDR